jgi:hypothetical protein
VEELGDYGQAEQYCASQPSGEQKEQAATLLLRLYLAGGGQMFAQAVRLISLQAAAMDPLKVIIVLLISKM